MLQGVYGSCVLGGRGSKNNCSTALGYSCKPLTDGVCKLWPLLGEGHGGNFYGKSDIETAPFMRTFVDGAFQDTRLNRPDERAASTLQILRFRAPGYGAKGSASEKMGTAKKRGDGGDRVHVHVDQDATVDKVLLLSIGNTVLFAVDDLNVCKRHAACERALKSNLAADKAAQKTAECKTCHVVELRSGDEATPHPALRMACWTRSRALRLRGCLPGLRTAMSVCSTVCCIRLTVCPLIIIVVVIAVVRPIILILIMSQVDQVCE